MLALRTSHRQPRNLRQPAAKALRLSRTYMFVGQSLLLGFAFAVPSSTSAALHTGTVELFPGDGWDFSDSVVTGGVSGADIVFDVTTLSELSERSRHSSEHSRTLTDLLDAISPAAILYVGNADSTYENLDSAPTDPDLYTMSEVAFVGDVFVVRTREGHYAKIRILPFGSLLRFEYTYQDNGSPSFVPNVPVRSITWGSIKALYRH